MMLVQVAGMPIDDSPGPSLPALVQTTNSGCSARKSSSQEPMTSSPSSTELMPKLMFTTTGRPYFSPNPWANS